MPEKVVTINHTSSDNSGNKDKVKVRYSTFSKPCVMSEVNCTQCESLKIYEYLQNLKYLSCNFNQGCWKN
ncbi:unnamed protein product [Ceratitis capitata]|uniref:(Mediterranean fruit fly) hypothetical protein n=1 Tax=Ceratitis capitata TaxID=7213 RepID=A0A811U3P6_CERCA|nr:unnamed protein product [Ceratitis capitata]